ncbi:MAG: DNA-processing protein DprA [Micrococcales bacterium]|nr:DNA-processing protein DprA [Micrococcales bacterium]
MIRLPFDLDDPVLALAAWSRLAEPGDQDAVRLVRGVGPVEALRWLVTQRKPDSAQSGGGLERAMKRWSGRLEGLDPRRELKVLHRLGGRFITPDCPAWPAGFEDLGLAAPLSLWVLGGAEAPLEQLWGRSVAVVGARACTHYGETVTFSLVSGLVAAGTTVVSGGAFGIDAAAHRAALAAGGRTVAVMAGGVDRLYPAAHEDLLKEVAASGAVISEVPPGSAPRRERFLERNRLMAAMTAATLVVEAGWRSGAHRTASTAAELLRPVGAVPGPVTSAASAGCHRLIREGIATLVGDAAQLIELSAAISQAPEPMTACPSGPLDGLSLPERRVFDALPLRGAASVSQLVKSSGLDVSQVLAALSRLERSTRAANTGGLWRRHQPQAKLAHR